MKQQEEQINWLGIALTPQIRRQIAAHNNTEGQTEEDRKCLTLWIHAVLMRSEVVRDAYVKARADVETSPLFRQNVKKAFGAAEKMYDRYVFEFNETLRGRYSSKKVNATLEDSIDVLDGILDGYLDKNKHHIDVLHYSFESFFMSKGNEHHKVLASVCTASTLMRITSSLYEMETMVDIIKPFKRGLRDFSCASLLKLWQKFEEEILRAAKVSQGEVFDDRVSEATKVVRLAMGRYKDIGEAYNRYYGTENNQ